MVVLLSGDENTDLETTIRNIQIVEQFNSWNIHSVEYGLR